jgi:hypothetical protein
MNLSPKSIETLLDLVEIKLSCFQVHDREDTKELTVLERCRTELLSIIEHKGPAEVLAFLPAGRPGGRNARKSKTKAV